MSIATEISRIQTDRNTTRPKLVELGLAQSADNLDKLAGGGNYSLHSKTIDDLMAVSVTVPAGYTAGGTVSLSGEIEEALAVI